MNMKKVFLVFLAVLIAVSCCALTAVAAPKDDIIAAARTYVPAKYEKFYLNNLRNTLNQIDVTEDQAAQVVKIIKETRAAVPNDKGFPLSNYTLEEKNAVVDGFHRACAVLGLTGEIYIDKNDVIIKVYLNGTMLTTVDIDVVKKTDVADGQTALIFAFLAAAMLTVGAFVLSRKYAAAK